MIHWAVPWGYNEVIDFVFLLIATTIVTAVPVVYGLNAKWRDPLARAVLSGTGATALAFVVSAAFTVALHAGWTPSALAQHWIARLLYIAVAFGKFTLLVAILRLIRANRRGSL